MMAGSTADERLIHRMIDAHQHFWDPCTVALPWLRPEHEPLVRSFWPADLLPERRAAGIAHTVLVQSANSDKDTDFMLTLAASDPSIGAVVAWVDLLDPPRAAERLDALTRVGVVRGIRHLIHDEDDPHWILRPAVLESLALLEERGLVLELPAVFPRHLGDVPLLAERFPRLRIVIDHLGKPPLDGDLAGWRAALAAAASAPNVSAKLSGLNTATTRKDWTADSFRPAVEAALELLGPDRLMAGSDWPVLLLNGSYARVWSATTALLAGLDLHEREAILGGTAAQLYALEEPAWR
jgi:L-fuconolactonase